MTAAIIPAGPIVKSMDQPLTKPVEKMVYFFASGNAEGNGRMKDVLGGKGAGLAEMCNAGLPVPPGFTIQTAACRRYLERGFIEPDLDREMDRAIGRLESLTGRHFGCSTAPLLVSVRSGAKFSMPGMMDTILNVGLNDCTVEALARLTGKPQFAWDCYRRLIQMYGATVLGIPKQRFDNLIVSSLQRFGVTNVTDLPLEAIQSFVRGFQAIFLEESGTVFPQGPMSQLRGAREAVFRSWNGERAKHYRRINGIPDDLGTAVNVQLMVFGNLGETSGTGVGFTRNPATGAHEFFGEFLLNAQGEDVVSGTRTPQPIAKLQEAMPEVYRQLVESTTRLEKHYRDVQDFEFTIEEGKLYILQTRNGKRTGPAAVRIAVDMVHEGLLTEQEAVMRVEPSQLLEFVVPILSGNIPAERVIARGLPASPGGAVGRIALSAQSARAVAHREKADPVILVRDETTPEDIGGMEVAVGILTSRGGMTSHAAVVARGMGKCSVVGAGAIQVNEEKGEMRVGSKVFREGDWISLDGSSGRVIEGRAELERPDPNNPLLLEFMRFSDQKRRLEVRANADTPQDAKVARAFGAQGIGLCRTEHMFFAADRIAAMRAMILAETEEDRRKALAVLLPMQRQDFVGIFRAMAGLPVTIRLLDPPLHEFLPPGGAIFAQLRALSPEQANGDEGKRLRATLERIDQLKEQNPMLGHRGCRLGITYPEITEMQARAIFEAALKCAQDNVVVKPEVMVPLVGTVAEFRHQRDVIERVAREVFSDASTKVAYMIGTMIEVPRAALCAAEIGAEADFFSFGTNDLTQMTYGFSRDDINKFLPTYLTQNILDHDPFASIDTEGVGQLVKLACELGRKANPRLEVGVCGEHGGDPLSVHFFESTGLDYVSCSPYRVLTARLAASQAAFHGADAGIGHTA